jgi:hypothetical protein
MLVASFKPGNARGCRARRRLVRSGIFQNDCSGILLPAAAGIAVVELFIEIGIQVVSLVAHKRAKWPVCAREATVALVDVFAAGNGGSDTLISPLFILTLPAISAAPAMYLPPVALVGRVARIHQRNVR